MQHALQLMEPTPMFQVMMNCLSFLGSHQNLLHICNSDLEIIPPISRVVPLYSQLLPPPPEDVCRP